MYLLIYNSVDDPIVRTVQTQQAALGAPLLSLSVQELLEQVDIFDRIQNGVPTLNWTLPNGTRVENSPSCLLINRVLGLDSQLFASFHEDDRDYAKQEFSAYLNFALTAFPRATARPGAYGLAGPSLPLSLQWERVKQLGLPLATPRYFFGPSRYCEFDLQASRWVQGTAYSYYHWKGGVPARKSNNDTIFVYSRPRGEPIAVVCAGEQAHAFAPNGGELSSAHAEHVARQALLLSKNFGLFFSESLFFLDGEDLSFGMISPVLKSFKDSDRLRDMIVRSLQQHKESPHA